MNTLKNSSILITGGAGFIGSHLAEALIQYKPKTIIIVDNLYRGRMENINHLLTYKNVSFIKGSITDKKLVDKLMRGTDYCFHMGSISINACNAFPDLAYSVMIKGMRNIVESAAYHKIKKLIFSSSASVYGLAQHFPTPESDNPYDNRTLYGATKLFGEQLLKVWHYKYGIDYVTLRYFNVYGPRIDLHARYTAVFIKWLECIRQHKRPVIFGGSTSMDLIYVTDIVLANILAATSSVTDETFNVGSGEETSLKKLLRLLLEINKSSLSPIIKNEKTVNPVSKRQAKIEKAKKLLGFKPQVDLNHGLKLLSEWYLHK